MFPETCSQTCAEKGAEAHMAAGRPTKTAQVSEKEARPAATTVAGEANPADDAKAAPSW